MKATDGSDCCAHQGHGIIISHLQSEIPSPTIKNAINEIVFHRSYQDFTCTLRESIGQYPVFLQDDLTS